MTAMDNHEFVPLVRFRSELEALDKPIVQVNSFPGGWTLNVHDPDYSVSFTLSLARSTDVRVFKSLDAVQKVVAELGCRSFRVCSFD